MKLVGNTNNNIITGLLTSEHGYKIYNHGFSQYCCAILFIVKYGIPNLEV